jgi:hypothetical protein
MQAITIGEQRISLDRISDVMFWEKGAITGMSPPGSTQVMLDETLSIRVDGQSIEGILGEEAKRIADELERAGVPVLKWLNCQSS